MAGCSHLWHHPSTIQPLYRTEPLEPKFSATERLGSSASMPYRSTQIKERKQNKP